MAVAPQEATLYKTLLPSQAFRSFPFFFFTEKVLPRAAMIIQDNTSELQIAYNQNNSI